MATATPRIKIIEEFDGVTLCLNKKEAEVLLVILRRIGGDPSYSPRKYADKMLLALRKAMTKKDEPILPMENELVDTKTKGGAIYFNDYADAREDQ